LKGTQPGGALIPTPYTPFTMETFNASPEAQLIKGQDLGAINAAQNASSIGGGLNSNNLKGLIDWTSTNTLNDYNAALNNYLTQYLTGNAAKQQQFANLSGISAQGVGAATGTGAIGAKTGGDIANTITGAGNANAAGTVGIANALTGGIGQGYNAYLQNQYLNMFNNGGITYGPGNAYGAGQIPSNNPLYPT